MQGLKEELDEEFSFQELVIDKKTSPEEIASKMKKSSPRLVILMDNISISIYRKYQKGVVLHK